MEIVLTPVEASAAAMERLEAAGVIRRMGPGKDTLPVGPGESRWVEVYAAQEAYGPHKLIAVTINSAALTKLAYHSAPEDFLLIGDPKSTGMILTMALCRAAELERKISEKTLGSEDFMALRCRFNDPELSFFTMNPYYAHVETCVHESKMPPSFYVGESRNLDENAIDFSDYRLEIRNNETTGRNYETI